MFHLTDIPSPPDSHYVGIIYLYEEKGVRNLITVKDKDKYEGHINTKLPGGSNERLYEDYMPYENYLFKVLERLNYEKKALIRILKNERKRKQLLEDYAENNEMTFVLRTMVLESLKKIGFYPLDLEPKVAYVMEKPGHTQYFVVVEKLMDGKGEEVSNLSDYDAFKALDLDIRETRVPMALKDFKGLILSHQTAIEKYILLGGK